MRTFAPSYYSPQKILISLYNLEKTTTYSRKIINREKCGDTQTPKYPDWQILVSNPSIFGDLSIVQGFCEV